MKPIPEWLGRVWLHDALRTCGIPWVPGAICRRPSDAWMGFDDRFQAIAVAGRVWRSMQRSVPGGLPAAALDAQWRDAAWRCTVAGLALLERGRWPGESPTPQPMARCNQPEAAIAIRPRTPSSRVRIMPSDEPIVIRRRGEARRAI